MGGNSSKHESTQKHYEKKGTGEVIDCNPYIATSDINTYIVKNQDKLTEDDRHLFQKAKITVAKDPDYVFRNCEIRVVGRYIDVLFWAGSPSNIYVVNYNENEDVELLCKEKCLRRQLHEFGISIFKVIRDKSIVIGTIAGTALGNGTLPKVGALGPAIGAAVGSAVGALIRTTPDTALTAIE